MGEIKIRWIHLANVDGSLRAHTKGKKKLYFNFSVLHRSSGSTSAPQPSDSKGFSIHVPDSASYGTVSTEPPAASIGELVLSPVRFSSSVRVSLMQGDGSSANVLAYSELCMQHAVHGVPRRVRLQLFPPPDAVSDDYPACTVVCEVALEVLPVDFGEDPSKVDHVRRVEEELPHSQRLRLLLTAVDPARLPFLEEEIAAARQKGWSAAFSSLVDKIPGRSEPVPSHLKVTIKQAFGVPREGLSYINTYVVASTQPPAGSFGFGEKFHTKTAKPVADPVFDESFQLTLLHGSREHLRLSLWDYDVTSADDWVGEVRLPLGLLVRGIPTTRKLPVFPTTSSTSPACWIVVELTAVDFGLDEQQYREVVERAVVSDLPRLVKYFCQRSTAAHLLRTTEELLIQHVLQPNLGGIDNYIKKSLIPAHGLEPGCDLLHVTIHSLQDLLAPSNRSKIDLSAATSAASPEEQLHIRVNWCDVPMYDPVSQKSCFAASSSRITALPDAKPAVTVSIPKPQENMVHIQILGSGQYLPPKDRSKTKGEQKVLAEVFLSLKNLQRNVVKKRTHALTTVNAGKLFLNGQVTVSLFSEYFGSETQVLDEELEVPFENKLRGMLNRYRREELPRLDEIVCTTLNPDAYLEGLIKKYGPPPGTYKLLITVLGCKDLPKLELGGLDPYVEVFIAHDPHDMQTTRTCRNERFPVFNESFEVDLCDPRTDNITLRVMDYDSNSADDPVSEITIPIQSVPAASAVTRWLPLVPCKERQSEDTRFTGTEGTIGVTLRAVGFGHDVQVCDDEAIIRQRIISLLTRFDKRALAQYETLMWRGRSPSESLALLIKQYGLVPGTGMVKATVHSVHGLMKHTKLSKSPKPYVVVSFPVSDGRACPRSPTVKTAAATPSPQGPLFQLDFSCDVDIEHPERDAIVFSVYNDIVGEDFLFGTARVPLQGLLFKDAPRKRVVPIIQDAGSASASIGGYLTYTLLSSAFGLGGGPSAAVQFDELDVTNAKRLFAMFSRYQPTRMHDVDAVLATTQPANFPHLLQDLVTKHGPEPGTYRVELTVLGCRDLPRIELIGGGDPYVTIEYEGQPLLRTTYVSSSLGPSFNQTFTLDLVNPRTAEIHFTVMDYDKNSEDDEWCKITVPVSSLCQEATTRWLPLVPCERKAGQLAGTLGFTAKTVGFGAVTLASPVASEEPYRTRMIKLMQRYAATQLERYECLLWSQCATGQSAGGPQSWEAALRSQVERYGFEPGRGLVTLVIHSIENLQQHHKAAKKATPYVEIAPEDTTKSLFLSKVKRTKTQKSTPGPNHLRIDESFEIDVYSPKETITLTVMNDITGADYEFGSAVISCQALQCGVAKKRTHPLVHKPGTSEASIQGYITCSLQTSCFGQPGPLNEEMELVWTRKLRAMYRKYERSSLTNVDKIPNPEYELQRLVKHYGPEPGTFRVQVTIIGCKKLPAIEMMGGCDPFVVVNCSRGAYRSFSAEDAQHTRTLPKELNPTFNETFEVDVSDPKTDVIQLLVMDYDAASEDDEVAVVNIPLRSVFQQAVTRWLPLALVDESVKPCGSQIGVTLRCIGFGLPAPDIALEEEAAYRQRVVKMYERYASGRMPPDYEVDLWTPPTFEQAIQNLVRRFGPEPGERQLTLTIHSITRLVKDGKPALKAKAYVEFSANFVDDMAESARRTKTPAVGSADHPDINQSFTFELQNPARDAITIRVMDDVIGADYEFGSFDVSAAIVTRGVVKKRMHPIYHLSPDGRTPPLLVGYVTLSLLANRFGFTAPFDEEMELSYANRLRKLYVRYFPTCPHAQRYLHAVDVAIASAWPNVEKLLADNVSSLGPEPGTFTMAVQVVSWSILAPASKPAAVRFDIVPDSACIVASQHDQPDRPRFELDFQSEAADWVSLQLVAASDPSKQIAVAQVRNTVGDRSGLIVTRTLSLVRPTPPHEIIGEVTVTFTTTTCGRIGVPTSAAEQVEMEQSYRRRLVRLFQRSAPAELLELDANVCGSTRGELEALMAQMVDSYGAEDGQTTIAVRILEIDDLADRSTLTSVYAKVHVNDRPVAKRLAADCSLSATSGKLPPDFSQAVDLLHCATTDMIFVKLAVTGALSSHLLGRISFPAHLIPMIGLPVPSPSQDLSRYHLVLWCFDEATRAYVGRVKLECEVKGFRPPPQRSEATAAVSSLVLSKEAVAASWRIHAPPTLSIGSFLSGPAVGDASVFISNCLRDRMCDAERPAKFSALFLHVVSCQVPKMDTFGTCDTFVEMSPVASALVCSPRQPRTTTVSGTLAPIFRFHREDVFVIYGDSSALGSQVLNSTLGIVPPASGSRANVSSEPAITLRVSDKDPGSEELIGSAQLSPELLFAGFWNVDPVQLAAINTENRSQWIAANKSSLLTLPLVLRKDKGQGEVRGEITLATTYCASLTDQVLPRIGPVKQGGMTTLAPTLARCQQVLQRSKQWDELERLHWFLHHQLFTASSDVLVPTGPPSAPLQERCQRLLEAMAKEFGGN